MHIAKVSRIAISAIRSLCSRHVWAVALTSLFVLTISPEAKRHMCEYMIKYSSM